MAHSGGDKNHEASALRRQKARSEGDFPRSFELAVALQVIGFTIVGFLCLDSISNHLSVSATRSWSNHSEDRLQGEAVAESGLELVCGALWAIAPLMVGCWLVVVASHWIQTGPVWLPGKVSADVSRVSPGHWFGQVFALSTLSYFFVGVPKFFLAFAVTVISFWCQRETIFAMPFQPVDQMGQTVASVLMQITFHVGLVLLASSAIDYWMHYLGFENRIRMTDQEMRDEARAQDGDPAVNAQRKALQGRAAA
jgi:flagellar biosynthetic protein FlhB